MVELPTSISMANSLGLFSRVEQRCANSATQASSPIQRQACDASNEKRIGCCMCNGKSRHGVNYGGWINISGRDDIAGRIGIITRLGREGLAT